MTDLSRLCPVCFNEKDDQNNCPVCRGEKGLRQASPLLPLRTTLADKYYIGKALKKNSEGITYSAFDIKNERPCSVRELFPDALANRDADEQTVVAAGGCEEDLTACKASFFGLWTKLYRLKGLTALISVIEVFAANGTVYAVYEESERVTLRDYLLEMPGGSLSWEKARILLMPVLSTLGTLHTSGIIHRGINPDAFIFSADGKLRLTDFCIEQARSAAGDINAELFDGYSALEQYATTGQMGTWTDIYAFTAVICRVLIGTTPIDAKTRAQNDRMMIPAQYAEHLPPYVINAIINGMELSPSKRTRTVEQLRSNLSASPKAVNASAPVYGSHPVGAQTNAQARQPQPRPAVSSSSNVRPASRPAAAVEKVERSEIAPRDNEKKGKSRTGLIIALVAIVIVLFIAIIVLFNKLKNPVEPEQTQTTLTAVETIAVPNFLGFTAEQIQNDETYSGSFVFEIKRENSATVQEGIIIGQSIPANTSVAVGTTVVLTVSSGKKTFVLPDYAGYTFEQAEAVLSEQHIKVIKSIKYNDGKNPSNVVVETIPPEGTKVSEGDTVQVVIWQDVDSTTETETKDSEENESGNAENTTQTSEVLEGFSGLFVE